MRPLKLASALWLCVLCCSTIGCMQVKEARVPGTYTAKADWGTSTLILASDHTFQQTVKLNSGEVKHMDGQWKLVGPVKRSVTFSIMFIPFLNMQHDKQGAYAPAAFSSITPTLTGGLDIAIDPDWGTTYRKRS
jgi:hypothetical protein